MYSGTGVAQKPRLVVYPRVTRADWSESFEKYRASSLRRPFINQRGAPTGGDCPAGAGGPALGGETTEAPYTSAFFVTEQRIYHTQQSTIHTCGLD